MSWIPAPNLAPDDAPADAVLASVRACAASWEGGARLLGNVRAMDITRAIDQVQAHVQSIPSQALEQLENLKAGQVLNEDDVQVIQALVAHLQTPFAGPAPLKTAPHRSRRG